MTLSRRQIIGLLAAGSAAACATPNPVEPDALDKPGTKSVARTFQHGVASGDPTRDSIVLWTRVTTDRSETPVRWELARDDQFADIVMSGEAAARADADHTVKTAPQGLEPGATYFYRFIADGETSPTGRTRTLPEGALGKLGVALVSCSNYPFGFFNAYDAIARDPNIDVVLHTGDYIYEYGGKDGWGEDVASVIGRSHEPAHEIVTLADYRQRHAQYKTDPGSVAMLSAHPLLCIWDDHESANNPWMNGAQNHQPETEGDWAIRRAAALQAYYEWMPLRDPADPVRRKEGWRSYSFGDLATLVTLETRHTARGQQVDYMPWAERIRTQEDRDAFMRDVINDPKRAMISAGMEIELRRSLGASVEAGQPWRLIGNPSPIARMLVPDVSKHGVTPDMNKEPASLSTRALFWKGRWNLPFYTDTWDGYPVAREKFYQLARSVGASDLVFLTGDSHSFWANELKDGQGRPAGLEMGTAGVTSPGDFSNSGWPDEVAEKLDRILEKELPEVKWTDNMHQGYVRVVLTPSEIKADFVAMDTILSTDYRTSVVHAETIVRNETGVRFA